LSFLEKDEDETDLGSSHEVKKKDQSFLQVNIIDISIIDDNFFFR
jgi:hypothetical protein